MPKLQVTNQLRLKARKLVSPVDKQLDRISSYKLVMYTLAIFAAWGFIMSVFGQVPYKWYDILISCLVLTTSCYAANKAIARYLKIPTNGESDIISALILTLILSPAHKLSAYAVLVIAAVVAMLSKYLLVINRWHIFNPAATGAFVSGIVFNHYASWWVGTSSITPVVFVGGMLILRKMKRFIMVITFELVALTIIVTDTYLNQSWAAAGHLLWFTLVSTPILFFAYIMLTEPLTSPRHANAYMPYAALVAILYGYTKLGLSPEEALLAGNAFAYLAEPQRRLLLNFKQKIHEASGIDSFIFSGKNKLKYRAGQYMEWTMNISQKESDFRSNRRYLTISSSPTEPDMMFTLRTPEKMSSFKSHLEAFKPGDAIYADSLSGTFTLPKSERQKVAFIAGGVGITPFRSMIKYVTDFDQQRDIHLLYAANSDKEFAFKDLFAEAKKNGIETSYVTGPVDKKIIASKIEDYKDRVFYISGPYGMINVIEDALLELDIPLNHIKIDYFPGYGA